MTNEKAVQILGSTTMTGSAEFITAYQLAIAALRSPCAGAMREACFEVADEVATMCAEDPSVVGIDADPKHLGAALTEIVDRCVANHCALPAPEVPDKKAPDLVRIWLGKFDTAPGRTLFDRMLRDMLREEYPDACK